jgi:potassium-transporting ATPase KdpC subunit
VQSALTARTWAPDQKLMDAVKDRSGAYRRENGLAADAAVPVDAVTSSASGLDPDIGPASALIQAARVARRRPIHCNA